MHILHLSSKISSLSRKSLALCYITKTGNGKTGNEERGTGNGERGTGNGERGTGNGEC